MKTVNVERNKFHGDWNYVIKPKAKTVDTFIYLHSLRRAVATPTRISPSKFQNPGDPCTQP